MADMFDFNVGGAGWHFTSHLVALAALIIACFAIAGHISFRDDSIPPKALEIDQSADDDLTVNDITMSGNLTIGGALTHGGFTDTLVSVTTTPVAVAANTAAAYATFPALSIPANCFVQEMYIETTGTVTLVQAAGANAEATLAITYSGTANLAAQNLEVGVNGTNVTHSTTIPIRLVSGGNQQVVPGPTGFMGGGNPVTLVGTNVLVNNIAAQTATVVLAVTATAGCSLTVAAGSSMKLVAVFRTY